MPEQTSRTFVHEGTNWRVWSSFVGERNECRPWKTPDPGPPRVFFYSRAGGFRVLPYPGQTSWETVCHLTESELCSWLLLAKPG
jgi:hypothetical protein